MGYKQRVPVRGAIILNMAMDKVVLVKGWKNSASWSFPRGKIDQDEDDFACAIREVQEETGYLIEDTPHDFLQRTIGEQDLKFYIVPGVPEDTKFECKTRKEISVSTNSAGEVTRLILCLENRLV
jgi:mRNA-decapping enzyme subunit 2